MRQRPRHLKRSPSWTSDRQDLTGQTNDHATLEDSGATASLGGLAILDQLELVVGITFALDGQVQVGGVGIVPTETFLAKFIREQVEGMVDCIVLGTNMFTVSRVTKATVLEN